MNRADIDTALDLLNELVARVEGMIDAGKIVPSGELVECLMAYDALVERCTPVPFIVAEGSNE